MTDTAATTKRRSIARRQIARALWYVRPGAAELRAQSLPPLPPDHALVRTQYSGISRGTERLVFSGAVPESEHDRMRAPLQEGAFPFPVKYGYCAAGIVEDGPDDVIGRTVFCLHPHQDLFIAPLAMLAPVPQAVPARRATLAANMETALNAVWDGAVSPGDTVVVVGGGIVGLMVATLAAAIPGTHTTLVDPVEARASLAASLGFAYAPPAKAPTDADVVFHTSATGDGLATAIASAGMEATVVELSWYGEKPIPASLGGAFHSRRLRLVSSQVGQVAMSHRPRWSYRRRLEKALRLLENPALDALVADEVAFATLPAALPAILTGGAASLPPVVRY